MENKIILQVVGFIILFLGGVLSYNPELVSSKPIPVDTFQAVERRVRWGFLMGTGMLLIFHHQITPYFFTVAALGMTLTLGALISRVMGIVLDGSVLRHWMWVAIELIMVIGFGIWYAKQRT
ncbi:hypothetical protein FX988_00922 [Paraglaciecola mesophila]|uniref:DUF4345 domain-containing protein n=1 Tax=Paraglaciecola mesophila TaxID=197222 RepID=A0A857JHD9_9ALTE|nr:hypothetical protein [Paraglaciecola mesophila]QHJ10702.1 hypothetical protein FX988_00922 [Paraglaciecola mesophila]